MKIEVNTDTELVLQIRRALKDNDGFCPCKLDKISSNKCLCEDFRLRTASGEYCHCGLYKKI